MRRGARGGRRRCARARRDRIGQDRGLPALDRRMRSRLGRGAIVLVPEIALTPQTAARFIARFGPTVAVLHSGISPTRRGAEHARIAAGEARVVVGARSAVFAAVPDLGMIVVDEEHDASYKHEADPRYDARRVAAKRARLEHAVVVFGSATPRPESWFGIPRRVSLPLRVGGPLPAVDIVDLRADGGYPLTRPLDRRAGRHRRPRWAGDSAPEPARSRRGHPLPHLRPHMAVRSLRRGADAARPPAGVPPLRRRPAAAAGVLDLRLGRPGPHRRRHDQGRGRAGAPLPAPGGHAPRRRRRRAAGRAGVDPAAVPAGDGRGAGGDTARGQGPRHARRRPGRGARRRPRARDPRLPRRGAHVRAC